MLLRWGFVLHAVFAYSLYNTRSSYAVEEVGMGEEAPPAVFEEPKAFGPASSQEVLLLTPQYTLEVPGTRGLLRFLLGIIILAATVAYAYTVTYPKVQSTLQEFFSSVQNAATVLAGGEPRDKTEILLERVKDYAEKNPTEVAAHVGALLLGFLFMFWGLGSLRKARRVKFVGI